MMRILYLGALAMVAAAPASAADFTFDIPVSVQNLPSMHTLFVECSVFTAFPGGALIANRRSGPIAMTGGNYEGTVTVEVNADGLILASEARVYRCSLEGQGTARTGATYSSSPDTFESIYELATGHTLLRVNNLVRGTIP